MQRPLIRIPESWALSFTAACAHSGLPSHVASNNPSPSEVAAHNPALMESTDASTAEKWVETWEIGWAINEEIARNASCRSDYINTMTMFQQLAEYERGRPPEVRRLHPVTVETHWLARWVSPLPHRSRSPSHATSHRASSPSHSCNRSRSPSNVIL